MILQVILGLWFASYVKVEKFKTIYIYLFLSIVLSCGGVHEEGKQFDNLDSQIVQALNSKDLKKANELISEGLGQDPDSRLYLYYSAQLSALKGNVDIYALFPIVKMELFEFAITEWGQIEEYSKKMKNGVETDLIGSSTDVERKTDKELNELHKLIETIDPQDLNYKFETELERETHGYNNESIYYDSNDTDFDVGQCLWTEYNERCVIGEKPYTFCSYKEIYNLVEPSFEEAVENYQSLELEGHVECPEKPGVRAYVPDKYVLKDMTLFNIEERIKDKKENELQRRYFRIAMALYESLGVISKVPDLDMKYFEHISKSGDFLSRLMEEEPTDRIGENSQKQLGLLAGFLILSSIKDSLEYQEIKDPVDIVCKLKPGKLFDNGPAMHRGLKFLYKSIEGTEFAEKNEGTIKKVEEHLRDYDDKTVMDYFISQDNKLLFIEQFTDYFNDVCL